MISGKEDAADNYARGYHTVGRNMQDVCFDGIRKLVEGCDNLSGFVLFSSIGGGTGSGFGTYLYENLHIKYPKAFRMGITI